MKIYISSTYRDLRDHRLVVDRSLRRMGHDVIGMEQYVAEGGRPLERCLADVAMADVYVLILAWRYGYRPRPAETPALSITELEYCEARDKKKPILAFLLDPDAPWAPSEMDSMSAETLPGSDVLRFRADVGRDHLAGIFRTPDDLASQVTAAVAAQGASTGLVDRLLSEVSVSANEMGGFGSGGEVSDSSLASVKDMIIRVGENRALLVDLGNGDEWWSTRLYLLASLARSLTSVRQVVFMRGNGTFAGMASPAAIAESLAAEFKVLQDLQQRVNSSSATQDRGREIDRQFDEWRRVLLGPTVSDIPDDAPGGGHAGQHPGDMPGWIVGNTVERERELKVGVRTDLLSRWLGDRLFARCIKVDAGGPTMVQIQQIVESVLPDVPVERAPEGLNGRVSLQVVDRDAFALELARQWVRSGLPRTPIR